MRSRRHSGRRSPQQPDEARNADERGDDADRQLVGAGERTRAACRPRRETTRRRARSREAAPGCRFPTRVRMACGTTSPTNPIVPLTETDAAVSSVAVPNATSFVRSTDVPRYAAVVSPMASRLSGRASENRTASAGTRQTVRMPTLAPRRVRVTAHHPEDRRANRLGVGERRARARSRRRERRSRRRRRGAARACRACVRR